MGKIWANYGGLRTLSSRIRDDFGCERVRLQDWVCVFDGLDCAVGVRSGSGMGVEVGVGMGHLWPHFYF